MGGRKNPPLVTERVFMKLFIAIPCYDGKVTAKCAEFLLRNTHILRDLGHSVMPYFHIGDPFISQARNVCVNMFLSTDCTDLIFVDADTGGDGSAISKLLKHNKDIVGASIARKSDVEEFPIELNWGMNNNCIDEKTGLVNVLATGMGLIRIQRHVFEKMAEISRIEKDCEGVIQFFEVGIRLGDGKWYGEDVYFCRRWLAMGGEIFVEPDIDFIHTGVKNYAGNFNKHMMGKRVNLLDRKDEKFKKVNVIDSLWWVDLEA